MTSKVGSDWTGVLRRRFREAASARACRRGGIGGALLMLAGPALILSSTGAMAWLGGGPEDSALQEVKRKYGVRDSVGDVLEASNWAGYAVASDFKDTPQPMIAGVSAEWTVPDLGKPGKTDVGLAQWVGIGGLLRDDDANLQAGIRGEIRAGYVQYFARIAMRPGSIKLLPDIQVDANDRMAVAITAVEDKQDTWRVVVENKTKGSKVDQNIAFHANRLTAEWVPFERPRDAGQFMLPPELKKEIRMEKCRFFADRTSIAIDSVPHLAAMNMCAFRGLMYVPSRDIKDDSFAIKIIPLSKELHEQMLRTRTRYKTIEQW
jgi:hypothetical protein